MDKIPWMISAISSEHASRELQEELKAYCEQTITFKVRILGKATVTHQTFLITVKLL